MKRKIKTHGLLGCGLIAALFLSCFAGTTFAGEPQIPNIFLNNKTKIEGKATVQIVSRQNGTPGTFTIRISALCLPPDYPTGQVDMNINMSDSSIVNFKSTTVEALSSTGKHSPTAYLMGRCVVRAPNGTYKGCHYWITLADNKKKPEKITADVVGFLVLDGNGNRIAYGTGPVVEGDPIAPSNN